MQGIPIPSSWSSLQDFANWYIEAGLPVMPPDNFETFRTDDAAAICTFRCAPYQVELYIIDNPLAVPLHEHPHVDVIQVAFDRSQTGDAKARLTPMTPVLTLGQAHGAILGHERPHEGNGVLYTFERWPDGVTPSTVSAVWKGDVVGPKHEALIRRFFPDAYIKDGYADITRPRT